MSVYTRVLGIEATHFLVAAAIVTDLKSTRKAVGSMN